MEQNIMNSTLTISQLLLWHKRKTINHHILHYRIDILEDIKSNIETILNTRQTHYKESLQNQFHNKSILKYGLIDQLSIGHFGNSSSINKLCLDIEKNIILFEPRFKYPKIHLVENHHNFLPQLNIYIVGQFEDQKKTYQCALVPKFDIKTQSIKLINDDE